MLNVTTMEPSKIEGDCLMTQRRERREKKGEMGETGETEEKGEKGGQSSHDIFQTHPSIALGPIVVTFLFH